MDSSAKFFTRGAFLAFAFCASQTVSASFVPSFGTYDATNAFSSHGLWFSDELVDTDGNGLSGSAQRWSVESATLVYADGGAGANTLNIDGVVSHNGFRLGFDFDLSQIADVGDPACGNNNDCQLSKDGTQAQYDGVQFFDFPDMIGAAASTSATISGLDELLGLEFSLSIRPADGTKPPQFGYCGNWVDCELGYSNWFGFTRTDNAALKSTVAIDRYGRGDLNLTVAPVPVPAAVWLFGSALLGLVGFNRRRKSA